MSDSQEIDARHTALYNAIKDGDLERVKELQENDYIPITEEPVPNVSAFRVALYNAVKMKLMDNDKRNIKSNFYQKYIKAVDILRYLIKRSSVEELNRLGIYGWAPIHDIVTSRLLKKTDDGALIEQKIYFSVLTDLIEKGVDLNIENTEDAIIHDTHLHQWNMTPLALALREDNITVFKMLLDAGADYNLKIEEYRTRDYVYYNKTILEIAQMLGKSGFVSYIKNADRRRARVLGNFYDVEDMIDFSHVLDTDKALEEAQQNAIKAKAHFERGIGGKNRRTRAKKNKRKARKSRKSRKH